VSATYVALGDSFTAGLVPGEPRWADEVARALGPDTRYENLAWVGATSADVECRQLEQALNMGPDVVTIVCGANDVLESVRPNPGEYGLRLDRMFLRIRTTTPNATILTATYPDLSRFVDLRERTRRRVRRGIEGFNAACRAVAADHDVLVLEWADHPKTVEPAYRAADGFHPSPQGHRRAAREVIDALRMGVAA
jgi:lysophospholipase L1-like esterase